MSDTLTTCFNVLLTLSAVLLEAGLLLHQLWMVPEQPTLALRLLGAWSSHVRSGKTSMTFGETV